MPGQHESQMLSSVQKRGVVQENDGGKNVDREKDNYGEQDAKSLRAHLHGPQGNPVGSPTRLISHGPRERIGTSQKSFFFSSIPIFVQ